MLASNRHWQLAKKRFPALRESRLLWFASDDDQQPMLPEQPENQPEQPDTGMESAGMIDELTKQTRSTVESVRPLVAKNVARSQFVYSTTIDILKDRKLSHLPNVKDVIDEGTSYLQTFDTLYDGKLSEAEQQTMREQLAEKQERLEGLLEKALKEPQVALAVAEAFEQRAVRYDELKRELGDTSPRDLVQLEARIKAENPEKLNFIDQPDLWSDDEVDQTLSSLKIDAKLENDTDAVPKSSSREVERAIRSAMSSATGNTEIADTPKERKLKLLRRKMTAGRQLAIMEQTDLGSETTMESATDIEKPLAEQVLKARENLAESLQEGGKQAKQDWDALRTHLEAKYGSSETSVIAANASVSELALFHRFAEIEHTIDCVNREALVRETNTPDPENLPKASALNFLSRATVLTDALIDLRYLHEEPNVAEQKLIAGLTREKKGAEAWAAENAGSLRTAAKHMRGNPELLSNIGELISSGETDPDQVEAFVSGIEHHATIAERIKNGNATAEDLDHLHDNLPTYKRNMLDAMMLAISSPAFMRQARRDKQLIERDSTKNTPNVREAVLSEVRAAEEKLLSSSVLHHYVSSALPIRTELERTIAHVRTSMQNAEHMTGEKANELVRGCRLTAAKLTKAAKQLDELTASGSDKIRTPDTIEEYKAAGGLEGTVACYNRRNGMIYINQSAVAAEAVKQGKSEQEIRDEAIYHEYGHAAVDILMNKTGVLPALMLSLHKTLQQEIPGDSEGRSFNDVLLARAEDWGITDDLRKKVLDHEREKLAMSGIRDEETLEADAKQNADNYVHELLMDELANKYATWKHTGSDAGFSDEDIALMSLLDTEYGAPPNVKFDKERLSELPEPDVALQMTQEELAAAAGGGDTTAESAESGVVTAPVVGQRITEAQNQFLLINEFIKNHQNIDGVDEFSSWAKRWEQFFESDVKSPFYDSGTGNNRVPESVILEKLKSVENDFISEAKKQIDEITRQEMEAEAQGGAGGLLSIFKGIEFASINDVIGMCKSIGEDLQRMWKRRAERVQSVLGQDLTGWIPDNNIWGLKYAGQLKHEFGRRSSASEIEEVKQWKDALDDIDSYGLEAILGQSRNKDQVRGIVELLIDRGRLDFNNPELWKTLTFLSGMQMPIEACKNNSVLRDKWLQQMVTTIWDDKDKFFEWRQSNDNGIDSGKKKFTQVADQLSNISGGLSGALFRQLKLWQEAKDKGESPPDEVNPHLYEELLHYAMRNGKMTMEDKLFFLVQGTRYGLISIDRLQALAGENGGVLNIFPFIDYFYGKNNSWPEIEALGKRLEETSSGEGRFKPGPRTTLWLHMELLRNESARQRISKATSGGRAENIDHEDIPTIIAQADYKTIERLTDIISGSREKLSPEAAKNTYTGFGTKFKILARLAELDDDGAARFTENDALEAGKSIASYIHMDNIFTRNGIDNDRRSEISWGEFETTAPSSAGLKVSTFRNTNNKFVKDLLHALGDEIDWKAVGTTADEYIRSAKDTEKKGDQSKKNNFAATSVFAQQIAKALSKTENRAILKKMLKNYAGEFREENYGDDIKKELVRDYFAARRNHQ